MGLDFRWCGISWRRHRCLAAAGEGEGRRTGGCDWAAAGAAGEAIVIQIRKVKWLFTEKLHILLNTIST